MTEQPVGESPEVALLSLGRVHGPELRALLSALEDISGELPDEAERLRSAIWPFVKAYDIAGTVADPG